MTDMETQMSCKQKYKELKRSIKREDILQFSEFFVSMITEYASSKGKVEKYRNLVRKGVGKSREDQYDLMEQTRELGEEVLAKIKADCHGRYKTKLKAEFKRAQDIMERAALSGDVDSLVRDQYSRSTQLTPDRFKNMIGGSKNPFSNSTSTSTSRASAGDIRDLTEQSVSLIADLLSRDATEIRPIVQSLLEESMRSGKKWSKQQLAKLQFPDSDAPSQANLRKLLKFLKTYFPDPSAPYNDTEDVLAKAAQDPEFLATSYTTLRNLVLTGVLTKNTDVGFGLFVKTVNAGWEQIKGGYRKELPGGVSNPSDAETQRYLSALVDTLTRTKDAMLVFVPNNCQNKASVWNQVTGKSAVTNWWSWGAKASGDVRDTSAVNVNCRNIIKEAEILDTVAKDVAQYVLMNNYESLKSEIDKLAGYHLVDTIKEIINTNQDKYSELIKHTDILDDLQKRAQDKS
jgi:hypothetical protein